MTQPLTVVPDSLIQQSLPNQVALDDELENVLEKLYKDTVPASLPAPVAAELAVAAAGAAAAAVVDAEPTAPPPAPPPASVPRPPPQQILRAGSPPGQSLLNVRKDEINDSHEDAASEEFDAKEQLEELQIQTIFSLVETATLNDMPVKLLTLTNKQAMSLNIDPLEKFIQAMELSPRPKFLINFSLQSPSHMPSGARDAAHVMDMPTGYGAEGLQCNISEPDRLSGLNHSQRKVMQFLRESILPVAIQTNALVVLGDSRCEFSRAFGNICETEAAAHGGKLPFTVLSISSADNFYRSSQVMIANCRRSISYQLLNTTKRWKRLGKDIVAAVSKDPHRGPWESQWTPETLDAVPGCTHYIIVDAVYRCEGGDHKIDHGPVSALGSNLIFQFSLEMPSIAICSFGLFEWGLDRMKVLSEYVGRGLPLLFLDSRDKGMIPEGNIDDVVEGLLKLELDLEDQGMVNFYYSSAIACLHAAMKRELSHSANDRIIHVGKSEINSSKFDAKAAGKHDGRHQGLICDVIEFLREKRLGSEDRDSGEEALEQLHVGHHDKAVRTAAIRAVDGLLRVWEATNRGYHTRTMPERRNRAIDSTLLEVEGCTEIAALNEVLQKASLTWLGLGYTGPPQDFPEIATKLYPDIFELRRLDAWGLVLAVQEHVSAADAKAVIAQLAQDHWQKAVHRCKGVTEPDIPLGPRLYDKCIVVMRSPCTYSNNLDDFEKVSNTISKVARIDQLPQANTYEGMFVLRGAWEKVDIYTHVCLKCKLIAKIIYVLAILLTVFVTTITAISLNKPDVISKDDLDYLVMCGTLAGSVLVSILTFINPLTKWQQLRGAALALESEIWLYRTRVGKYALKSGRGFVNREPDVKLQQVTTELASSVLKSSSVLETSFLSKFDGLFEQPRDKHKYRHGQYHGCRSDGTFGQANLGCHSHGAFGQAYGNNDDHHAPLTAAMYLQLRIKPQLEFYQGRLPKYARSRAVSQVILVSASVAGSVLAFLKESQWAVIATSVSAAVTAYASFQNAEKKLSRFSNVIAGIDSALLWWNSLTEVEQVSPPKIEVLVQTCEGLFQGEREAWVTTAISTAIFNSGTQDDKSEKNGAQDLGSQSSSKGLSQT